MSTRELARAADGHPRRQQRRSADTRRQIVDAAAHLLATSGYSEVRLRTIADRAKVSTASLYYYFGTREEIVSEVLSEGQRRLHDEVAAAVERCGADASGLDRLLAASAAHVRSGVQLADYARASICNYGHVPETLRWQSRGSAGAYERLWSELLAAAQADGSVPAAPHRELTVRFGVGALNWSASWWAGDGRPVEGIVAAAEIFLRHGLTGSGYAMSELSPVHRGVRGHGNAHTTRDRILHASAQVLRARGYPACQLAEIAALAAVSPPALYRYFASRQDLLATVIAEGSASIQAHVHSSLEQLPADRPVQDAIATAVAAHLEVELELSDFAAAAIRSAGHAPEPIRNAVARAGNAYQDIWRRLVAEASAASGLRDGLTAADARVLIQGTLNWAVEWWTEDIPVRDAIRAAQCLIYDGLFQPHRVADLARPL